MLRRLEANPYATFGEEELRVFGDPFDRARRDGLLKSVELGRQIVRGGRLLTILADGDGLEAIDEDDTEFDPVPIEPAELRGWQVDLAVLSEQIRVRNDLREPLGSLTPRLWMLGFAGSMEKPVAVVLALLGGSEAEMADLRSLPTLVPQATFACAVISQAFASSPQAVRELEALSIHFVKLHDDMRIELASPIVSRDGVARTKGGRTRSAGGGRPGGRTFGALLDCWLSCYDLARRLGSTRAAYDAIDRYFTRHPDPELILPRIRFPAARSYARRARAEGPCRWHRHAAGVPSEILSE